MIYTLYKKLLALSIYYPKAFLLFIIAKRYCLIELLLWRTLCKIG